MSNKANNTMKNKAKHTLTPKLRFPEFRREPGWAETPLDACLDYQQPTPYLVSDTNYSPSFKTPVLTAGKTFVLGYTNEQHGIFTGPLPVIIFDDFTTATQFVDFPFKAKSSAMKILQAKNEANIKFMYETLQTLSFEVGAHERHWISTFAPMMVYVPKPAEQSKIAACLGSLDDWIAAEGRNLAALRDHKRGLMQQLFPQPGQTQPRLRFPKFRDKGEWEESKVCERTKSFSGGTPDTGNKAFYGGTIPFIRSAEISQERTELFLTEEGLSNSAAKMVRRGDLLVALYGANSGDVGLAGTDGAINQAILCLRTKDNTDFLYQFLIARKDWIIATYLQGGQGNLSGDIIKSVRLQFPSLTEQQRIAACLTALDTRIAAQAAKLDALQTHKQGLMQQLFPAPDDHPAPAGHPSRGGEHNHPAPAGHSSKGGK